MSKSTKNPKRADLDAAIDRAGSSQTPPAAPASSAPGTTQKIFGRQNELLRIADLNVDDHHYQRPQQEPHINDIVTGFDNDLFTSPIVVRRIIGGTLWIVDGQQRIAAAREAGGTHVWCSVLYARDVEHEAWLFVQFDRNQKRLSPQQLYKANLTAREPITVACEAVLNEFGLTGMRTRKPNGITSVRTLREPWANRARGSWLPINDEQLDYGSRILRGAISAGLPLLNKGEAARHVYSKALLGSLVWIHLNAVSVPDPTVMQEVISETTSQYLNEEITGMRPGRGSAGGSGRAMWGTPLARWINQRAHTTVIDLPEMYWEKFPG